MDVAGLVLGLLLFGLCVVVAIWYYRRYRFTLDGFRSKHRVTSGVRSQSEPFLPAEQDVDSEDNRFTIGDDDFGETERDIGMLTIEKNGKYNVTETDKADVSLSEYLEGIYNDLVNNSYYAYNGSNQNDIKDKFTKRHPSTEWPLRIPIVYV